MNHILFTFILCNFRCSFLHLFPDNLVLIIRLVVRFSDKKKAGIPIVAMTANAFTEDKERALESGMNDHVAKPIDMKVLMSVLEEQICGHKGL